jgi:hypothetical protein
MTPILITPAVGLCADAAAQSKDRAKRTSMIFFITHSFR